MSKSLCENMMCTWREPWKPFGHMSRTIDGREVTLCANCTYVWISDNAGDGRVTLGTTDNYYVVENKEVAHGR